MKLLFRFSPANLVEYQKAFSFRIYMITTFDLYQYKVNIYVYGFQWRLLPLSDPYHLHPQIAPLVILSKNVGGWSTLPKSVLIDCKDLFYSRLYYQHRILMCRSTATKYIYIMYTVYSVLFYVNTSDCSFLLIV